MAAAVAHTRLVPAALIARTWCCANPSCISETSLYSPPQLISLLSVVPQGLTNNMRSVRVRCRSMRSAATEAKAATKSSWPATWHELVSELWIQGYAGGAANPEDWGTVKRAVLAFSRAVDLLPESLDKKSLGQLVDTEVDYVDRKVKNARERLALLFTDGPLDKGTGRPTFQDVMRLCMAVQLAGSRRTADNEAAALPVLQQVVQLAKSQLATADVQPQPQQPAPRTAA